MCVCARTHTVCHSTVIHCFRTEHVLRIASLGEFIILQISQRHLRTLRWSSPLLPGYKPAQHVAVLSSAGSCNTAVSILHLNIAKHRKGAVKYGTQYFPRTVSVVGLHCATMSRGDKNVSAPLESSGTIVMHAVCRWPKRYAVRDRILIYFLIRNICKIFSSFLPVWFVCNVSISISLITWEIGYLSLFFSPHPSSSLFFFL